MPEIAEFCFPTDGFLKQPRIRIRRRLVSIIAPALAMKTHRRVFRIVGRLVPGAPRFETLVTRPRLEQRAVDREVLVREQTLLRDRGEHFPKERVRDIARRADGPGFW